MGGHPSATVVLDEVDGHVTLGLRYPEGARVALVDPVTEWTKVADFGGFAQYRAFAAESGRVTIHLFGRAGQRTTYSRGYTGAVRPLRPSIG